MMGQLIELIYSRQIENYRELEDALREIETEREWKRRDKRAEQNKGEPFELTEEQEKEVLDAAVEKRENGEEVELEDETGELTLSIARMLYMKKPNAYIGMFNGNYQARMKREGGKPTPPK